MYISLHNRSAFSFGSALTRPAELVAFAKKHHMPAIALTDLNGLYAAVPFQQLCQQAGIKPIIGAELRLLGDITVTLLAQSLTDYGNLCRLVSLHHLREEALSAADLCEQANDLICLLNPSPTLSFGNNGAPRQLAVRALQDVFHNRLYIELSLHKRADRPSARDWARIADQLGIPVVATCASRCVRRDQMQALRALSSIGTLTLLDQTHPDKPDGDYHLRTPAEMKRLFQRRPDALRNTVIIAECCAFTFDLSKNRFPPFVSPDGRSAIEHLRKLAVAGCRRRYVDEPQQRGIGGKRPTFSEALERLERELAIIDQVHYAEYFLVFHEIVEYCRREGIASLARGSAADSLICYALGVSHACPFRFDLPFDRFVNPERAKFSKMADIDLDLPWDKRDQVIRWVYDRWGHDRVAMIGAANTFHGRAAVAELGKVFGLPAHEVHQVTKQMPRVRATDLSRAINASPEAQGLPTGEEPFRSILQMAGALEGLPRHWAMHPCGLVVSPEPLTDLVPVRRSPKGMLVAQFDMDAIEALGFVKIDLLGQAGLSVLRDTVTEIERTDGVRVDLDRDIDYADESTWDMIAGGEARGVHHIESPAMTSLIRQCNVRDIDALTTIVAIIRPGAANQGKKDKFARRHQGFEQPEYAHPVLEPVLRGTYGLMVFEEHILQVAVEFAGMNLGRADVLRRALNKEDRALISELKEEFVEGARRGGRTEKEIAAVWPLLEGFAGFMFNKAHSAEYAVEAFQGAYLKRRRPAHYLAAILSNYRGFYAHSPTLPQILYVLEALRLGVGFLAPCVNRSRERFTVEHVKRQHDLAKTQSVPHPLLRKGWGTRAGAPVNTGLCPMIRVPVSHTKGLSTGFVERYLTARQAGVFTSLADCIGRCRPGEAEARALLDSGALDCFNDSRPVMFWQLRRLCRRFARTGNMSSSAPALWEESPTQHEESPPIELTCPDAQKIARREMELLGFPITIDPLTFLGSDDKGNRIDWDRYVPINQLHRHVGRRVRVCGLMVADRINRTRAVTLHARAGDLMKFVTLADRTGFVETFLFPDVYRRFGHLTAMHPILAATCLVEPFENQNGFTLRTLYLEQPFHGNAGKAGVLDDQALRGGRGHHLAQPG